MSFYLRPHTGRGLGGVKISEGEIGRGFWINGELKMSESIARVMGGPSHKEAREIIKRLTGRNAG